MSDERVELEKLPPPEEAPIVRPGYPRAIAYHDSPGYRYGYGTYGAAEDDELHLRDLWRTVRKRKWLILTIALIVTTIVTIDQYRSKSIYQASAMVEIGKDTGSAVKAMDYYYNSEDSDMFVPIVGIKTKMLFIRSRPLLEQVAVDLSLEKNPKFLDVGRRKSFLDAIKSIGAKEEIPEKTAPADEVTTAVEPRARVNDQPRPAEESTRLAPYVGVLMGGLTVDQIRDTRALTISYTHTDPAVAATVANGIARAFIASNYENKTEKYTKTSEFLETSTRQLKARVQEAEQALANYTRENSIFSTDGKDATLTTVKLTRLHEQSTRAEADRMLKQTLYDEVKAGRGNQLPDAFADPKIGELQKELNKLEVEAANLDAKYGPDNPRIVAVKQQMEKISQQLLASRQGLNEKIKADYERAVRDEASLKQALDRAKGEAVQQNQAAIQYNILKQEVETAKSLYNDFLQKANQAKVQLAEQQNNLRLIEPAQVPGGPVGPRRMRAIMIALFLALSVGVGLAFFLEYLDNTIKTVEDVNRYTELPALSVIPAVAGVTTRGGLSKKRGVRALGNGHTPRSANGSQLVALDARSSAAEAYRVLRTSVLLSAAGNPPRTILITSGQPGEGKTTTVVNTAISLAQLGAKVLVIDCDLRKPTAHKAFGADHLQGVSTYLSRNIELDGLIQKLQIPNLSLLACGPIPPNPAELISSERMKEMLKLLGEQYDHILIDSPPLIQVTDPVILSTMVDGVILVVHGGKSTRDIVRRARQELSAVGAKIFGVVLNNVDLARDGYDDYYYYRYYTSYDQEGMGTGK